MNGMNIKANRAYDRRAGIYDCAAGSTLCGQSADSDGYGTG